MNMKEETYILWLILCVIYCQAGGSIYIWIASFFGVKFCLWCGKKANESKRREAAIE